MFKSVLIIILVVIILFVGRSVLQRLKRAVPAEKSADSKDTVQCLHCKTYIPCNEAIVKDGNTFCSRQHFNDWNRSS